jgi:hypothetical protein
MPAAGGSHDWLLENARSRIGRDVHGATVLVIVKVELAWPAQHVS